MQSSSTKIGSWEIHTKGFGSKILKTYGWKEGQSVGKNSHGLIEPLICEAKGQFDGKQVNVIKKSKVLQKNIIAKTVKVYEQVFFQASCIEVQFG